MKNGNTYDVTKVDPNFSRRCGSGSSLECISYLIYDEINNKVVRNTEKWRYVKQILIEEIGDVMVDPESGEKFPPTYRFNPYSGRRLSPAIHGE